MSGALLDTLAAGDRVAGRGGGRHREPARPACRAATGSHCARRGRRHRGSCSGMAAVRARIRLRCAPRRWSPPSPPGSCSVSTPGTNVAGSPTAACERGLGVYRAAAGRRRQAAPAAGRPRGARPRSGRAVGRECIRFARRAGYRSMVLWTQASPPRLAHLRAGRLPTHPPPSAPQFPPRPGGGNRAPDALARRWRGRAATARAAPGYT